MPGTVFFSESSRNIGGQELQLLRQAQGLQAQGWRARVLCRPGSRIAEEAARRGLPVDLVPFRNAIDPASLRRVISLVREHGPRAVVCHSGHDANVCAIAVRLAAALGLVRKRPRLVRMRTYQPGKAGAFGYNHLFDASFTPSAALRAELLRNPRIRPERVHVLYPAIDFPELAAAAQEPLSPELAKRLAGAAGPVIVHAAMLRPEKGHAFFLRALPDLLARFPTLLYVVAGEGVLRAELEGEVKRLGLETHVHFAGMVQPVAPLMQRADVLVMPSLVEPLGMSQVEALALGVPVVVSEVGGLPETVRDGVTGRVCPAPDAPGAQQAWVGALTQVLADPATARAMARRGGDEVRQQFDPARCLQELQRAFG